MSGEDWQLGEQNCDATRPPLSYFPHHHYQASEVHSQTKTIFWVFNCTLSMSLTPLMFRSLLRLMTSFISEPTASVTTLLYYSELLPQSIILQRLVRHDMLDDENYLFHFLVNFLRCFW